MFKKTVLLAISAVILSACTTEQISPIAGEDNAIVNNQQTNDISPTTTTPTNLQMKNTATSVTINTSMGTITLELFPDKAPQTVENFIGLAQEKKPGKTQKLVKKCQPLYTKVSSFTE